MISNVNTDLERLAEANVRMVLLVDTLENLRKLEKDISNGGDIEVFYDVFLEELTTLLNSAYGAIALFDQSGGLEKFISYGLKEEIKNKLVDQPKFTGIMDKIIKSADAIIMNDIEHESGFVGFPSRHPHMHSLIGIPITVSSIKHGMVFITNKLDTKPYNKNDKEMLKLVILELNQVLERRNLLSKLASRNLLLWQEKKEQALLLEKLSEVQGQLLQSEKMASIGQLAAGVAHEINNPVGYVNSNIKALDRYINDLVHFVDNITELSEKEDSLQGEINGLKKDIDYEFIKEDVEQLMHESKEGINRVIKIVQDLKDFSHVDEEEWQFTDLTKGIESTLNVVNNEVKYKAEVMREYGEIPKVECIASQVNQVIMNLIINSSHAIEVKGTITISTGLIDKNKVWIKVADTGKGIEEKNMKKLFDPFFSTKPVGQGTGLGLSLSYSIIKKHNGTIEVESVLGKGTCFTIILPIKQEEKALEV